MASKFTKQSSTLNQDDVPKNLEHLVENIQKNERKPIYCESCEKSNDVKWKCEQCYLYICQTCKEAHGLFPVTASHIVTGTDVAVTRIKDDIQEAIDNINQHKTLVTAKIEEAKIFAEKLTDIESKALGELNKNRDKLLAVINDEHSRNIAVVKDVIQDKRAAVDSLEEQLNSCLKHECEVVVENLRQLKDKGELGDFVSYSKRMNLEMKRKPVEIQTKVNGMKPISLPDVSISSPAVNEKANTTTVLISQKGQGKTNDNLEPNYSGFHFNIGDKEKANPVPKAFAFALENKDNSKPRPKIHASRFKASSEGGFQFSKDTKGNTSFFWNKPEVDFSSLSAKNTQFIEMKVINLPNSSTVQNIHVSGEHLWVTGTNSVYVFDKDLHMRKSITGHWELDRASSVFPDHTGNIIACVGENGLLYLDKYGWYRDAIIDAVCYYAVLADGYLYALTSNSIFIFMYKDNGWVQAQNGTINYNFQDGLRSMCEGSVAVRKNVMYVSRESYINKREHSIPTDINMQSQQGTCVQRQSAVSVGASTYGKNGGGKLGKLRKARICGIDETDNLLVTDWQNNRIQICNKDDQWSVLKLQIEAPMACYYDHIGNWLFVGTKGGNLRKYYINKK